MNVSRALVLPFAHVPPGPRSRGLSLVAGASVHVPTVRRAAGLLLSLAVGGMCGTANARARKVVNG